MTAEKPTFGYVVQTVPRGYPDEVMARPALATRMLIETIERAMEMAWPHFDTLWIEDHLQWDERPVLEALTALCYLSGRHEGWRFGTLVLSQSFRNPALLAKMAAVLDALTGGRLIMGIGAGWKEDEYRAYGYPYPGAGERIEQLEEAVQIMRLLWTQGQATFAGKHYRIEGAECRPQPEAPIPLLIAGGGEQKLLRVAARHADWWSAPVQSIDEYAHKQRVLTDRCREVGRDPSAIKHTFVCRVGIVDSPDQLQRPAGRYVIGGTVDEVAEELRQLARLGVRHFHLSFLDFPRLDGLQTFVEKVIPRLEW